MTEVKEMKTETEIKILGIITFMTVLTGAVAYDQMPKDAYKLTICGIIAAWGYYVFLFIYNKLTKNRKIKKDNYEHQQ